MKLAEALQERADINSRLAELYPRLSNNAIVQEGEKPAEDPQSLIDEIESCTAPCGTDRAHQSDQLQHSRRR